MAVVRLVPTAGAAPILLPRLPAAIGSDEDADVFVPGAAPRHAVLFERDGEVVLVDSGSPAGTIVGGRRVDETVLRSGDAIQLGEGGPEFRYERQGTIPVAATPLLSQTMVMRALRKYRRSVYRTLAAVVAVAALAVGLTQTQNRALRREVAGLRNDVRHSEAKRAGFERRVDQERARIAAEEASAVQALRDEVGATREQIATLETERAVGERIIRAYGNGVCLIQGSYAFVDSAGRSLRYASATADGEPAGNPVPDGKGAEYTVDYYGTGFLVDATGLVLTNRHVAEPWWNDPVAQGYQAQGFEPRFVTLRAFFPHQGEALGLSSERVSEDADLALMRAAIGNRNIPVLPLETRTTRAVAGQPVVVVGYPTGLEAILAKAETGVVKAILDSHGTDSDRVTDALSRKGLIRPSTTQGHIGDITASDIVFDAPSAQGGSGGPVFNKHGQVIAVEYAVLPKFGGNSFGVPIAYALALMRSSARPAAR